MMIELTELEKQRYIRNILVNKIGEKGQLRLKNSSILIIGAGGLGSVLGYYCAAAGFGTIGIAEYDTIEISNLNRQILHSTHDINKPKIDSAVQKLSSFNPEITFKTYDERMDGERMSQILTSYDVAADGTDNFESKFMINDACVKNRKPFVHASVLSMSGEVMTVIPGKSACLRCLFLQPPSEGTYKTSKEVGILGSVAGIAGSIQATECIKLAAGLPDLLTDTLLTFDAFTTEYKKLKIRKNPECPVCSLKF